MPKRKDLFPLQRLCMKSIAFHFDLISYGAKTRKEMCKMIFDESYMQFEGPYKYLPSPILEGLLETIVGDESTNHRLRRTHFHLLIQPHLEGFRLSSSDGDSSDGFLTILRRCKRLRRLDLSYLRSVGPPMLLKLIPNLKEITSINLSMTHADDQVLGLIGLNCPWLTELDVSNTAVTDVGLTRLCYDANADVALCQHLVSLGVIGCAAVTARTIASILVRSVRRVKEVDFEDGFKIFHFLRSWGFSEEEEEKEEENVLRLDLRILNSIGVRDVRLQDVHLAIHLCPKATTFTMSDALVENEVLYKVMMMENLTHLRLTNDSQRLTIDFPEGVLPLITVKGHQLITLLLANFASVDVVAIGECCPKLENLALSNIGIYEEITFPREHFFNQLRNLEVWSSVTSHGCNDVILRQLLQFSPQLTNLLVKDCDALSDKLLFDVWRVNKMPLLSRLTLDGCQHVTSAAIHHLLDQPNRLTLVRLWSCYFFTKDEEKTLQQRIKNENCDLYLECY